MRQLLFLQFLLSEGLQPVPSDSFTLERTLSPAGFAAGLEVRLSQREEQSLERHACDRPRGGEERPGRMDDGSAFRDDPASW
jgi:hypothetical protein